MTAGSSLSAPTTSALPGARGTRAPQPRCSIPRPAYGAPTGSLNAPRDGFFAVTLADGRVLVTGGMTSAEPAEGVFGAYSSTKLYDPATGTWSATGLLGRRAHTTRPARSSTTGRCSSRAGTYIDSASTARPRERRDLRPGVRQLVADGRPRGGPQRGPGRHPGRRTRPPRRRQRPRQREISRSRPPRSTTRPPGPGPRRARSRFPARTSASWRSRTGGRWWSAASAAPRHRRPPRVPSDSTRGRWAGPRLARCEPRRRTGPRCSSATAASWSPAASRGPDYGDVAIA